MNDDTTLRIERTIAANPAALFAAWTTPDSMRSWYRDRADDVVEVEQDLRVGGRYRVTFGPAGAPPYVETGEYLELESPHRIVMTETLATPDGGAWSDTKVTVTFEAVGTDTRLTLLHERFPSTVERDNASGGWPGFIDRLERLTSPA